MPSSKLESDQQFFLLAAILPPPWRYFARSREHDGVRGGVVHTTTDLALVVNDLRSFDIYIQLNPSAYRSVKANRDDLTALRAFFIDIDPIESTAPSSPLRAAAVATITIRDLLHGALPAVLDTGRGAQLWYYFAPIYPIPSWADSALRELSRRLQRAISWPVHGCRLDLSVFNPTHLARMPGSYNSRTGRLAQFVSQGAPLGPTARHEFSDLASTEPAVPDYHGFPVIQTIGQALAFLPLTAAQYLTEGVDEGDRHRSACSAIYALRELGIVESDIAAAVHRGNELCAKPLKPREINRILQTTTRRVRCQKST